MAAESSEGEEEGKHIGGNQHLLVDDDLREMAKSLKFPLTSAATVLLLNKHTTGARGQDPPRCQRHGLPVRLYEQDEEGKVGVLLSKDLMTIAGGALKANITTLGRPVLSASNFSSLGLCRRP